VDATCVQFGSRGERIPPSRGDPAWGAKALPQTPCRFQGAKRQRKGKGGERGRRERGKGVLGKGKRGKRRAEGRGKGKEEGKGGEGEFASLALGGIDASGNCCCY